MVLDQQVPFERAFSAPSELRKRLGGTLEVSVVAEMDPAAFATIFSTKPALHRFPSAMSDRVQKVARVILDDYNGDAASIWNTARSGDELVQKLRKLPGFGEQKAWIFLALLAKRFGVQPEGWQDAAGPCGVVGSFVSVADIDGPEALLRVREHKREMKARAKSVAQTPKASPGRRTSR
jgi:uncharacterized HhH-GPD family protein